ncbi:hypothetical protein HHL19_12870 [Streptomyces sp. R302]|uniref:Acb2/Tad1 domain-containing protein n=1 Tax=unclassified Streptomyces TaxID=2593676 RepID=UPI00145CA785|nr:MULTISPECIES: hypothetical protein [unclassified Streptomyces]NML50553.1 hypothetical protein [Streptomyces sp. R301]NML79544.1 hypothetical protein [Streptomyces sp. R302]
MNSAELAHRFNYHPPRTPAAVRAHESVREQCTQLAGFLDSTLQDGREKALAITNLEQVMFWANAAIARA